MTTRQQTLDQSFEAVHAWYRALALHASNPRNPEMQAGAQDDILKTAKSEALERVRCLVQHDGAVGILNEALVDVMLHEEAK